MVALVLEILGAMCERMGRKSLATGPGEVEEMRTSREQELQERRRVRRWMWEKMPPN